MLWKGPRNPLEDFLNYLNEVHPSIKFEWKISKHKVSFLDCNVIKENNKLKIDVYQKLTDCHPYLDYTSAHPSHFKTSIPCSQALRLRRISDDQETLKNRIRQYSDYFVACGYRWSFVKKEMEKVLKIDRKNGLKKKEKRKESRIPLVVSYHPDLPPLHRIINKHWPTLQSKKRLKKVFKNRPIVSYKRPRNLRDMLVKATFNYEESLWNNTMSCSPCQRCSWYKNVEKTTVFRSRATGKEFQIHHSVCCKSSWIIYLAECKKYKIQYCGKAETKLNIRFNNNRKWLKDKMLTCELVHHFATHPNHDFEKDLSITIIEQLKSSNLITAQKKRSSEEQKEILASKVEDFGATRTKC